MIKGFLAAKSIYRFDAINFTLGLRNFFEGITNYSPTARLPLGSRLGIGAIAGIYSDQRRCLIILPYYYVNSLISQ